MSLQCPKCGSDLVDMSPAGDCLCTMCRHVWRVGPGPLELRLREYAIARDAARAEAEAREEPATLLTESSHA